MSAGTRGELNIIKSADGSRGQWNGLAFEIEYAEVGTKQIVLCEFSGRSRRVSYYSIYAYCVVNDVLGLLRDFQRVRDISFIYFEAFYIVFSKIKNKIKTQAASRKEAGGDEKHVCFFTCP